MSGIQLGEKQVTLEDLDAILFGNTPVTVDDALVSKIQKMGKGKHAKTECVKLGSEAGIKNRVEPVTLSPVEGVSKTCALFALLSLLKGEGIRPELLQALVQAVNSKDAISLDVFRFAESIQKEDLTLGDHEKEYLSMLSPRTTALSYLAFIRGEKTNILLLATVAFLIATLNGKIDSLAENVYEIDHPHRCAAYIAQMLRLMLFGASNLKEDRESLVQPLPELLGPLYDHLKQLKLSLQAELNAPATSQGSAILLSHLETISTQYRHVLPHLLAMATALGDASLQSQTQTAVATLQAAETALADAPASLRVPLQVLEQQRALQHVMAATLATAVATLQKWAAEAAAASETKAMNPEIEARLAAERAKEEAEMDPATLARIREKRAAKEAKKNKKAAGKKEKKLNVGNGVQAVQQELLRLAPSASVETVETALELTRGPLAEAVAQQFEALKSGGVHRKPKVPKGTRDFLPEQMEIRSHVMDTIRGVFRRHGAVEIDTPVFEEKETLMGKYGEDSKLIYDLADQGGEILSLRYDLTVPFARFLAVHQVGNIKRFHIAKVYRRDNPVVTKGRYREFYQCDFDIAGSYGSMISDADVLAVGVEIYRALEIGEFAIKVNHRELLDSMMEICGVPSNKVRAIGSAIDKLDKETWETVRHEMVEKKGLAPEAADRIHTFVTIKGDPWTVHKQLLAMESIQKNERAMRALEDLRRLFEYLDAMGYLNYLSFDLSLARGLDYYTGLIYEVVLVNNPYGVGSIGAGGRYDHLVGMFNAGGKDIPCVGISIGVERVFTILERKAQDAGQLRCTPCSVLVTSIGKDMTAMRMKVAAMLWRAGISAEFGYQENPKLQKQLAYALETGINWVVVMGEEEMKEGKANLKNLKTHEEVTIPIESIVEELVKQGAN